MSTAVRLPRMTPEDLLRIPDGNHLELVDGEILEKPMSVYSCWVAGRCIAKITEHVDANKLGWAFTDGTTYQCFAFAPKMVRKPDASFIKLGRLTREQALDEGHIPVVPDLIVEVVSPNDVSYDVTRKINEFLRAGTLVIWVIHPDEREIHAHRKDGIRVFHEADQLEAEDVLPGFRCLVGDLFKMPGE